MGAVWSVPLIRAGLSWYVGFRGAFVQGRGGIIEGVRHTTGKARFCVLIYVADCTASRHRRGHALTEAGAGRVCGSCTLLAVSNGVLPLMHMHTFLVWGWVCFDWQQEAHLCMRCTKAAAGPNALACQDGTCLDHGC